LAKAYQNGGADLISVLTEERRFKGKIADFIAVRSAVDLPILRKDFIVTEFQVYESRMLGADLILLIVAALTPSQLTDFYQLSTELGMDVLVEVHDEDEAQRAIDLKAQIIGVNSRNLKTLEVSDQNFERILPQLPMDVIKVAESGINTRKQVEFVERLGANAILVGECLVKSANPRELITELLNR
jgi:indole-3-glycerol phosphate synthase